MYLKVLVDDVDGHVEGLLQQLKLRVHFHQPVYEDTTHFTIY
jgi:hypothetical protein